MRFIRRHKRNRRAWTIARAHAYYLRDEFFQSTIHRAQAYYSELEFWANLGR